MILHNFIVMAKDEDEHKSVSQRDEERCGMVLLS